MSYSTTATDLKQDALDLAGEPYDGSSQYEPFAYEWLTVVQRALVSGGQFGPSPLIPVDWLWARAWPRGAIQLVQPANADGAVWATFMTGQRDVLTNPVMPSPIDLSGWRIHQDQTPARHLIASTRHDPVANVSTLTLAEPWTGPALYTPIWKAYPDTYELPTDFVRGCSPLFLMAFPSAGFPYMIDVLDPPDLEREYPASYPLSSGRSLGGIPVAAARVSESKIRFSHYLYTPDTPLPVQLEFEYIRAPAVLGEGSVPVVPIQHRRILSYGLAYLIASDKNDTIAGDLWGKFEAQWKAMVDEYRRTFRRMSSRWGRVQPSRVTPSTWAPARWTSGGLPVWSW